MKKNDSNANNRKKKKKDTDKNVDQFEKDLENINPEDLEDTAGGTNVLCPCSLETCDG
ncbi:MAG: hypothetical protein RQ899_09825 [Pseudomonadales bacterium]|nr:hypothetical protein [Pseudomonadales bacterium]